MGDTKKKDGGPLPSVAESRVIEGLRHVVQNRADAVYSRLLRGVSGLPPRGSDPDKTVVLIEQHANDILNAVSEYRAASAELELHESVIKRAMLTHEVCAALAR